jgi:hypothetical protein
MAIRVPASGPTPQCPGLPRALGVGSQDAAGDQKMVRIAPGFVGLLFLWRC